MPDANIPSAEDLAGRELIATRVFNAPRELVFSAWTDPNHLKNWWGPNGFTNTFHEFDLRPGGNWRFIMHGPDGTNYKNHMVFVEITPPERIVMDHLSGHQFRLTATFEDVDGKTRLTFRQTFPSVAECEKLRPIAGPGNEQNLDRLGDELAKMV